MLGSGCPALCSEPVGGQSLSALSPCPQAVVHPPTPCSAEPRSVQEGGRELAALAPSGSCQGLLQRPGCRRRGAGCPCPLPTSHACRAREAAMLAIARCPGREKQTPGTWGVSGMAEIPPAGRKEWRCQPETEEATGGPYLDEPGLLLRDPLRLMVLHRTGNCSRSRRERVSDAKTRSQSVSRGRAARPPLPWGLQAAAVG